MDDGPADDGRVLDGSGIVGSVGALVLAIAVLPYVVARLLQHVSSPTLIPLDKPALPTVVAD